MQLPTWNEIANAQDQLNVLEYPLDRSLFVVGPPGSGKTVLALHRARMLVEAGSGLAVKLVTYNRMLRRLLEQMKESATDREMRIVPEASTMHTFIWHDFKQRTGVSPPQLQEYVHDWDVMLARLTPDHGPERFHLVVDEGQDLPYGFFRYASRVSGTMSVFADEDQAIADQCTSLADIKTASGLNDPLILTKNHRNAPEVARMAEHFHGGGLPAATVLRPTSGERPRLYRSASLESTAKLVSNWCVVRGGSVGIVVDQNGTGDALHALLVRKLEGKRVDIYRSDLQNEGRIDLLSPGVTLLNKASIKGQEFDTVFLLELDRFLPCKNAADLRAMYMMCTRARDSLFLVYGPDSLTQAAVDALPSPDILERS